MNLNKEVVGKKYFEGIIDITDPCYDKGVWCRMTAEVVPGEYDCIVHTIHEDEDAAYKRVAVIGIYLSDHAFDEYDIAEMRPIGTIGVDAGLAGFFMDKPDYTDIEWSNLCDELGDMEYAWMREEGFFSSSGYGDGGYPVYATYNESGKAIALEIQFIWDEAEEDEDECCDTEEA